MDQMSAVMLQLYSLRRASYTPHKKTLTSITIHRNYNQTLRNITRPRRPTSCTIIIARPYQQTVPSTAKMYTPKKGKANWTSSAKPPKTAEEQLKETIEKAKAEVGREREEERQKRDVEMVHSSRYNTAAIRPIATSASLRSVCLHGLNRSAHGLRWRPFPFSSPFTGIGPIRQRGMAAD